MALPALRASSSCTDGGSRRGSTSLLALKGPLSQVRPCALPLSRWGGSSSATVNIRPTPFQYLHPKRNRNRRLRVILNPPRHRLAHVRGSSIFFQPHASKARHDTHRSGAVAGASSHTRLRCSASLSARSSFSSAVCNMPSSSLWRSTVRSPVLTWHQCERRKQPRQKRFETVTILQVHGARPRLLSKECDVLLDGLCSRVWSG